MRLRRLSAPLRSVLLSLCALTALAVRACRTPHADGGYTRFLPMRDWGFCSETVSFRVHDQNGSAVVPSFHYRRYGFFEVDYPCTQATPYGK
jgi:hypothetical protein